MYDFRHCIFRETNFVTTNQGCAIIRRCTCRMGGRKGCEAGELNPAEPCTIGEQLKHEGVAWRALLDTELARNENEECVSVITDY